MISNHSNIDLQIPVATGITLRMEDIDLSSDYVVRDNRSYVGYGEISPARLPEFTSGFNSISGIASWEAVQNIEMLFEVKNPPEVFSFINSQISSLLISAHSVIHEYFSCSKLTLKLQNDMEEDFSVLLLTIHSKTDWKDSEKRLDTFDKNWWLSQKWFPITKRISIDVIST